MLLDSLLDSNHWMGSYISQENRFALFRIAVPSFIFHEFIWLCANTPYVLIERYQLFQSYKIQKSHKNNFEEMKQMFFSMIKEQFFFVLPIVIFVSSMLKNKIAIEWDLFPEWKTLCLQLMFCAVCHDIVFYVIHRLLHTKWLYGKIHKIHHENTAPFALSSEHAHPAEFFFGFLIPFIVSFVILLHYLDKVHLYMIWISFSTEVIRSVEGHSGYCMPWHIDYYRIFSWYNGGSIHHDLHHSGFNYNFGPRWLDLVLFTDEISYRKQKEAERKKLATSTQNGIHHDPKNNVNDQMESPQKRSFESPTSPNGTLRERVHTFSFPSQLTPS